MGLVHEALLDQRLCGLYAILVVQAAVRLAIIVKKLHNCRRFTMRQLSAEGIDIRARILVSRRIAGGFQCAKLMDMILNTVSSGATLRLFATSTIGYNEAVQDLHHARLIEVGCARLRLGYDTATPHAGFQVLISSGTRRARFAGLDRLMYREDIRKLLDRWVPWSRHVDTVPPPPGALAVRWSSVEHMRTYARNARAA